MDPPNQRRIGRYVAHHRLGFGGMAQVSLGRLVGDSGFSRVVAIKELLPQHADDAAVVDALLDEARIASHIKHPNVVAILDVVRDQSGPFLVMDYVLGAPLGTLCRAAWDAGEVIATPLATGIAVGMLEGLHAAHDATDEGGVSLGIVHRDVSPQNVLVGVDGVARLTDFGIAKALNRAQVTTDQGTIKGKVCYMAPEQFFGRSVDRRADVWAAALVLWEMLAGRRCFEDPADAMSHHALQHEMPGLPAEVPAELAAVVMRGLARDPDARFATAREMVLALEAACPSVSPREVGTWVRRHARAKIEAEESAMRPVSAATTTAPGVRGRRRALFVVALAVSTASVLGFVGALRALDAPGGHRSATVDLDAATTTVSGDPAPGEPGPEPVLAPRPAQPSPSEPPRASASSEARRAHPGTARPASTPRPRPKSDPLDLGSRK